MQTVREAATRLSYRCDGAVKGDGVGFNKMDSGFMKDLLTKTRWTFKQERAAHRALKKYRAQLEDMGINYDELVFELPETPTASPDQPMVIDLEEGSDKLLLFTHRGFTEKAKAVPFHKWIAEKVAWRYLPRIEVLQGLLPYLTSKEIIPSEKARPVLVNLYRELQASKKAS